VTSGENAAAREQAIAAIVRAVEHAAQTLESHGRPGIQANSGASGDVRTIHGWDVSFPLPDSAVPTPDLRLARPDCRCHEPIGWYTGVFADGQVGSVILAAASERYFSQTPVDFGGYQIAGRARHGYTDYTRDQWRWETQSPRRFAEGILTDTAVWLCHCGPANGEYLITARADPGEYRAFVNELARIIGAGFEAMTASHLSRMEKSRQNWLARHTAIESMVTAIEQARGRVGDPGPVLPNDPYTEPVHGWRVALNWSAVSGRYPVVTPPPRPKYYRQWGTGAEARHVRLAFVALTDDGAVALPQQLTYQAWQRQSPQEFAKWILQDWFVWSSLPNQTFTYHMADHSEPAEFAAYVQGVAAVIATGFGSLRSAP
jgi:hypothetical protein